MLNYTLRIKRTQDVIGDIAYEGTFAGLTRAQASELILPHIQAQYPQVTSVSFGSGDDGRRLKNLGSHVRYTDDTGEHETGELMCETVANGASNAGDDGKERKLTTRKAQALPSRDEKAIAWLMDGRMGTHTLEQAYEAVDAQIAQEVAAIREAKIAALKASMLKCEDAVKRACAQYSEIVGLLESDYGYVLTGEEEFTYTSFAGLLAGFGGFAGE